MDDSDRKPDGPGSQEPDGGAPQTAASQAAAPETAAGAPARASTKAGYPKGPLGDAIRRMDAALAALEAGIDDHLENHVDNAAAAAEVQRLNADRARLARSLDEAEARANRLDGVNREVSRRLVDAMETIRSVLQD